MPSRFITAANRNPAITTLVASTCLIVGGLLAIGHADNMRAADLQRVQAEDLSEHALEDSERGQAIVRICETLAARVEVTFQETYDVLRQRGVGPAVYAELTLIAAKNLNPAFCSPPALEGPTTTSPKEGN